MKKTSYEKTREKNEDNDKYQDITIKMGVNVDNIFHVIISLLRKVFFFHIFGMHYHFFIFGCFGFWLWFFWLFLIRSFLVYGRRIDYSSRD